jgi:hypothetical protein
MRVCNSSILFRLVARLFDVLCGLRSSLLSGRALGRDEGNLIAVAQRSSEGNISFVPEETAVKQPLIRVPRICYGLASGINPT